MVMFANRIGAEEEMFTQNPRVVIGRTFVYGTVRNGFVSPVSENVTWMSWKKSPLFQPEPAGRGVAPAGARGTDLAAGGTAGGCARVGAVARGAGDAAAGSAAPGTTRAGDGASGAAAGVETRSTATTSSGSTREAMRRRGRRVTA
jgi:hypothetical protein